MIEKVKSLFAQLSNEDAVALKHKWLPETLSPEAKKIDTILSKLPEDVAKEILSSDETK
jgi:division protein CdvB (Snf7/Vps24/ESCRT-III family)